MKTVRLQVGNIPDTMLEIRSISFPGDAKNVKIINAFDEDDNYYDHPSTLRDIAIVLYQMVGCGVTWQLANELSNRLNINNPTLVNDVISELFKEYENLSDDEAYEKWENFPKLYDPTG
jgi:phospholipase C